MRSAFGLSNNKEMAVEGADDSCVWTPAAWTGQAISWLVPKVSCHLALLFCIHHTRNAFDRKIYQPAWTI